MNLIGEEILNTILMLVLLSGTDKLNISNYFRSKH